jgi:hypothetical protein
VRGGTANKSALSRRKASAAVALIARLLIALHAA